MSGRNWTSEWDLRMIGLGSENMDGIWKNMGTWR